MTSLVYPINSQSIQDEYALMIIRNIAGQEHVLAAKKTALLWDVRFYIAQQMKLTSDEIKLMLNYEQPHELARIGDLDLESSGHLMHLLVDKVKRMSHMYFMCGNCHQHCNLTFCMDWDANEECCHHPDGEVRHRCCEEPDASMYDIA